MGEVSSLYGGAPASVLPLATALDSSTGTDTDYARADHTHAARVQRAILTTDVNGNATWTFARPFLTPPACTALPNTTGSPIAISISAKSATSVTFNCKQAQALPGVLASLAALLNFNIFANPAAAVQLDCFAGDVTQ